MRLSAVAASLVIALALTACSKSGGNQVAKEARTLDVAEAASGSSAAPGGSIKIATPQIAYTYNYGFTIPRAKLSATIDRHVAMCDRLGAAHCHVVSMARSTSGEFGSGSLKLSVDARMARKFGADLTAAVDEAGGERSDMRIEAEDLSKQIVDTEAKLRGRQALADRLLTLLKSRDAKVADLVAAERALADVQEEIDAARTWLAEARGRIDSSTLDISYNSGDPDLGSPLREAFSGLGLTLSRSVAFALTFAVGSIPWVLLAALAFWGIRALWRRRRR